jgi:hypothetical protein
MLDYLGRDKFFKGEYMLGARGIAIKMFAY